MLRLGVDRLETHALSRDHREEERLQRGLLEGTDHLGRELAMLLERRHEMRVTEPARGFNGAELGTL